MRNVASPLIIELGLTNIHSKQRKMASSEIPAPTHGAPLLILHKLDKRFGANRALKAVDLTFEQGEIHAIVGENGAGKSTLIKLLTGVHTRSSGRSCSGAARRSHWRRRLKPLISALMPFIRKSCSARI